MRAKVAIRSRLRETRDLEILDRAAVPLNREMEDTLAYQGGFQNSSPEEPGERDRQAGEK